MIRGRLERIDGRSRQFILFPDGLREVGQSHKTPGLVQSCGRVIDGIDQCKVTQTVAYVMSRECG
jgi:hypothetical protein